MEHPTTLRPSGRAPLWRRQQFWRVALPIVAGVAALLAAILVYNAFFGTSGVSNAGQGPGVSYPPPKKPKTVKLDPSVNGVVSRFIETAVARKNLAEAYWIVGPQVRQGMTMREWLTGNIAVVPFPVDSRTHWSVKATQSYATHAQLAVFIVTPGRKVTNSPHSFYVDMIKQNGKWLVNSWVPRWTPPIPTNPGR